MPELSRLPASILKLKNFCWAPNPVSQYVTKANQGLGIIGSRNYAAFNIAWALCGQESLIGGTKVEHQKAVAVFALQEMANKQVIQGAELGDWITLYDSAELLDFVRAHKDEIESTCVNRLFAALTMRGMFDAG